MERMDLLKSYNQSLNLLIYKESTVISLKSEATKFGLVGGAFDVRDGHECRSNSENKSNRCRRWGK